MSESIVRKVQPFTIGTRLSVPAGSKCQDFTQTYLQNQSLDNCIQHNLNSLYLSRSQVCARGPCLVSPIVKQVKRQQEDMAAEDHLNQNVASGSSAVSRSIKKITISGSGDVSEDKVGRLSATRSSSENNNNNNNISSSSSSSSAETHLPRIVGVSCENKPNSHFKVLLRRDGGDEVKPTPGQTGLKLTQDQLIGQVSSAEPQMTERPAEAWAGVTSQSDGFTQRNSLFNREALQAEAWIKGKLQDLKDGCNIQRCPLQDWEEASQTLHRDLKDFENTLIQLNQMGEQLICKTNPSSDLVKKQLSQLRDQWQTLKQTAANQTRALGGAKNLQEFNRKVDKLETWIKQKEEEPSLVDVLGENVDKMQLTRRILDLKQDEQLYRTLHEDINHLALKLEKQGKTDGKNIGSRRKHINKMWIRVQSHLKNCHQNLQLALEVSTFYQQAENTLSAMSDLRKSRSSSKDLDGVGDREIRDLATQIMMLDVSVSQLSNLHPVLASGVSRKHSEVKDGWTQLQRVFRSDRTGPAPAASPFTREDGDPVTPAWEPQGHVGTEAQRTMGKEVKEEQNRLKGCVGSVDSAIGQIQEFQSVNHVPSPTRDDLVCAHEVMVRRQPKGESRKSRLEPTPPAATTAAGPGHPPLHIQLQKFTVSADKTLSWLKDNVSMATQVCSVAGCEGLEAAHRCQQALEQEILTNRARIEVVKREGRSLVRAQHPGSAKIQEFLGQLEVLWEELRRRHQRNQVFLQASKDLGFRVVKVLQALGSLEAWLESVELSMKESSLAGDPETMSVAERESRLLEREVAARSPELDALRQEVERLHCHSHAHTRGLPGRMDQVEKKYRRVQSALTQQSSELQDTRMLTEFLERVELEEIQDLGGSRYSLGQPLHADISSAPTLLELQGSGAGDPLMEGMGDPVEELREAVEMLNDTARERGRSQSHDQAITELLRKHAGVALRVEETLSRSKDLSLDILEKETDMAVQCEPDRCGLEGLQDQQDQLEMDYEVMRGEVQELQDQASQLQDLCPERLQTLWTRVQTTLEAWAELRTSLTQIHGRLQEFVQLQDFFRRYLGMISWTEDTRSCIFSDTALHFGKDGQRPLAAELDMQIEQKFEEFDELAATGRSLLDSEHHLMQMVKERMEELRSMLGWILVHWRVQKQQWLHKKNRQEASHDNIYSEATTSSASAELGPDPDVCQTHHRPAFSDDEDRPTSGFNQDVVDSEAELGHLEDGYEVMKSVGGQGSSEALSGEMTKTPILVLKEPGSPALGGTVNLILSFGGPGDQVRVLDAPPSLEEEEPSEPVRRPPPSACKTFWRRCQGLLENTFGSLKRKRQIYRQSSSEVSTYLHVKDNSVAPVYESITLPRLKSHSAGSASPTFSPSSSSSLSTSAPDSQTNVNSHGSSSIFSSLKRISKKRKRKRDTRRHTIQKIMGVEEVEEAEQTSRHACDTLTYDTHTWPLKERRRRKNHPKSPVQGDRVEAMAYMKNPLLKDIDTECLGEYSITPYAVSEGPPTGAIRSHCRFLSLGSVLSFDLPKDMTLIPSIQDIITIAPPKSKKVNGTSPHSQRPTPLSSFKQTRPAPVVAHTSAQNAAGPEKDPPDVDRSLNPPSQDKQEDQRSLEEEQDSAPISQLPIYINQPPTSCTAHKHECPSVHTLIRDLNGHRFHKCVRPQTESGAFSQASHMVVNLKSTVSVSVRQDSVDSGISSSSSLIPSLENPQPRGVVGKVVSLEVGGVNCTKTKAAPSDLETEAVCLDHQQFEEEEEELEDIWNQTSNYRQSICSDIMYQPSQDDTASSDPPGDPLPRSPSPHAPVLYRNLVTASAPNLLVAEFRLPPSVQSLLGYDKETCPGRRLPPLAAGDRRSWAAFPHREPTKTAVGVNETASDLVKLPDVGDNQRYIYQYREDEEEEEEEVKVGQEVEVHTGGVKESVQSRSLFSVHMGLDAIAQQRSPPSPLQDQAVSTEGRCLHANLNPEPPSMEGTLERKHKLQLGGKKAASRGWSSFHAVLHRHTLCFYQDRKETLRSSACALPLNLTAAECSPALDYNKKPNCFRLRLRDGSEYLLNASSRFMMKKWMMKIQASTGRSEGLTSGVAMETDITATSKSAFCSGCRSLTKCHCSSQHDVISTIPRLKPPNATEIVVLTRELSHMTRSHMRSLDEQSTPTDGDVTPRPGPGPTDWSSSAQDWISSKRRSHSFTSATFQKIRPPLVPLVPPGPRGLEPGSNYCVTLVVGDKSSEQNPDLNSGLRSYMSLPRPRNKSVFKKFFGKKDF